VCGTAVTGRRGVSGRVGFTARKEREVGREEREGLGELGSWGMGDVWQDLR